jgi:hypothetical protein
MEAKPARAREPHPPEPAAQEPGGLVMVWPELLYRELIAGLLVLVLLGLAALLFDAPLDDPADPTRTPNPARAPWYFVGFQELLHYFDPWVAGVAIPLVIVFGLCAIPYLDSTRAGQGVYSVRERPLASTIFAAGTLGWFALIAVGLWFRGPGWVWMWPWAPGTPTGPAGLGRSLPNLVGIPLLLAYFGFGAWWIVRRTAAWPGFTAGRRWTFAALLLAMVGTGLKIVLRLLFDLQYLVRFDRAGFGI